MWNWARYVMWVTAYCAGHGVEEDGSLSLQYRALRFLGAVAEGPHEAPPGGVPALELGLTQQRGVSYSKGCYLGQELTARTRRRS